MESASTSTSLFDSHPLPHLQFSSRIAFIGNNNNNNNKRKVNSFFAKKSTRLPPIARCDSSPTAEEVIEDSISINESLDGNEDFQNGIDPNLRVKRLEKNLEFVKEHSQSLLKCLHNELDELKAKNRDLQFQLIIGGSLSPQQTQSLAKEHVFIMPIIKGSLPKEISEHLNKLDKEVKRLRFALRETLKMNAILQNELQKLRKGEPNYGKDLLMNELGNNDLDSSPAIGDFNETFNQIYSNNANSAFSLPRITNSSSK